MAAIEWDKLGELIYVAPIAGFVVAVTFGLLILGWSRADEARRGGSAAAATGFGLLALLSGAAFFGSVAWAISVIATK